MANWFKQIMAIITSDKNDTASQKESSKTDSSFINQLVKQPSPLFAPASTKQSTQFLASNAHSLKSASTQKPSAPSRPVPSKDKDKTMGNKDKEDNDSNLKALKRLRELPRGTQVDSRIAAIKSLLGNGEIFKTLKMLRWPQGVLCPRCQSSNVVRREPPEDAPDQRHYYICLNCKGEGSPSDFDDFSGLPIKSIHALRQWILCWYLIGFCSINQIAKVLGLSVSEVAQMAKLGSELTELPAEAELLLQEERANKEKKSHAHKEHETATADQENRTRSESKAPLKPGYKSKK